MSPSTSSNLVLASCLLSVALAAAKLVAAAMTGSGAVLAEFIHSIAVATSQALLLIAMRRAAAAPEAKAAPRALGELRFWALVVPMLVYSLGSGVALNEGTAWLQAPRVLTEVPSGLIILAVLLAVQAALAMAIQRRARESDTVHRTVYYALTTQSTAALAGLGATLSGLAAAYTFDTNESDALAAVTVGLIMGGVAAMMALAIRKVLQDTPMPDAAALPAPETEGLPPVSPPEAITAQRAAHRNHPPPKHGRRKRR